MAYERKYYGRHQDKSRDVIYRTELLQKNGAVGDSEITLRSDPLQERTIKLSKEKRSIVYGSERRLSFVMKIADTPDEIFQSDYLDWRMDIYSCTGSDDTITGGTLIWRGYVQVENIYKSITGPLIEIDLSATDGLKDLSETDFSDGGIPYSGKQTIMEVLKNALSPLEIDLDFLIKLNTHETTQTATNLCFLNTYVDTYRFAKNVSGKTKFDSCLEVIEKVLKSFNVALRQVNGKYRIYAFHELNTFDYAVDWATLTQGTRTATSDIVDVSDWDIRPDPEAMMIAPIKNYEVTHLNRNLGQSLVANLSDWTGTGPWDIDYDLTSVTDEVLKVTLSNIYPGTDKRIILNSAFSVTKLTDDDYLKVRLNFRFQNSDGVERDPNIKISVQRPDLSWHTYTYSINSEWESFESQNINAFSIVESGNYNVKIEVYTIPIYDDPDNWGVDIYLKGVDITKIISTGDDEYTEDVTFDRFYRLVSADAGKKKIEEDVYFGDSPDLGDLGSFYVGGGADNSVLWTRQGLADDKPVIEILGMLNLTDRRRYKESMRVDFIDPDNTLQPDSIIKLTRGGDTKYYNFQGFDKSTKKNIVKARLEERIYTDVGYTISYTPLTSIDGEKTSTSTVIAPSSSETIDNDSRYVNINGDTMTGDLVVPNLTATNTITAESHVVANTIFRSSDNQMILGPNSDGTIYLRPRLYSSTIGQSSFTTALATIGTPLSVTGNITVTGTVDGRDVAADGGWLDTLYTTIGLSDLTFYEVDQLENIGAVTISNVQWGYLGALDQGLTQASAVTFATVNTGQGANELYAMNQNVRTTDSPTFATAKLSSLTDGYVPYHVSDAAGLANSVLFTDGTNIGIGTTDPVKELTVNGDIGIPRGKELVFMETIAGNDRAAISATSTSPTNELQFFTGTHTENMRIDAAGNVGIGTTAPNGKLHVLGGGIKITASGNDDSYGYIDGVENTFNTHKMTFGTTYGYNTKVDAMTIFNGNVGIGTTDPAAKLEVNGDSQFNTTLQSPSAVSRTTGWQGNQNGDWDFRSIFADTLVVKSFTADVAQAFRGSRFLTKSFATIKVDFTIPAVSSTGQLTVNDVDGFTGLEVFETGDFILLAIVNSSNGGLVVGEAWGEITSAITDNGDGTQTFTFTTRDVSAAEIVGLSANEGSEALSFGSAASPKGFIHDTVLDAVGSPWSQVVTWVTNPWTRSNWTVRTRLGNLTGITDADVGGALSGYGLYSENVYLKGTIVASLGEIGGWEISATELKDTAGVVGLSSAVTAGDDIRFWAGHATPASAPFSVTEAGVLTAVGATIKTAGSGQRVEIDSASNTLSFYKSGEINPVIQLDDGAYWLDSANISIGTGNQNIQIGEGSISIFNYTGTTGKSIEVSQSISDNTNEGYGVNVSITPGSSGTGANLYGYHAYLSNSQGRYASIAYGYSVDIDATEGVNYGMYSKVTGIGANTNVGIRAEASGATENYAGFFVGDVAVSGDLIVDGATNTESGTLTTEGDHTILSDLVAGDIYHIDVIEADPNTSGYINHVSAIVKIYTNDYDDSTTGVVITHANEVLTITAHHQGASASGLAYIKINNVVASKDTKWTALKLN